MIYCSLALFYEKEILKLSKKNQINVEIYKHKNVYENSFLLKKHGLTNINNKIHSGDGFLLNYLCEILRLYQTKIQLLILEDNLPKNIEEYIKLKGWLVKNEGNLKNFFI